MSKGFALVTGASSGIGTDIARQLAARGYPLIITARRRERLEALREEIITKFKVEVIALAYDLAEKNSAEQLFNEIQSLGKVVEILVNNAGVGVQGKLTEMDIERIEKMFQLNVTSLTLLTQLFARDMMKRGKGYILQVASMAAFQPTPYMAAYAASKAYVTSFSDAVRYELRGTGVSLTTLFPGITPTEFNIAAGSQHPKQVEFTSITPARVAAAGIRAMFRRRRGVVPGFFNKIMTFFVRILPVGWTTSSAGAMMKKANQQK